MRRSPFFSIAQDGKHRPINYHIMYFTTIANSIYGIAVLLQQLGAGRPAAGIPFDPPRSPYRWIDLRTVAEIGCQTLSISNSSKPYQKPVLLR